MATVRAPSLSQDHGEQLDDPRWMDCGDRRLRSADIYANDQTTIFFRKARTNGAEEVGRITGHRDPPCAWRVEHGAFPGATVDVVAGCGGLQRVIERVAGAFDSSTSILKSEKDAADLPQAQQRRYRAVLTARTSQKSLGLKQISHDKHVEVRFSFHAGRRRCATSER